MRLSSLPLLVPALACLAQAESGKLYIYQSQLQAVSSPDSAAISPDTARLIIASHLGLDQYHDVGSAAEDSIQAINDLASSQHLFTQSAERSVAFVVGQAVSQSATRHHGSSLIESTGIRPCS